MYFANLQLVKHCVRKFITIHLTRQTSKAKGAYLLPILFLIASPELWRKLILLYHIDQYRSSLRSWWICHFLFRFQIQLYWEKVKNQVLDTETVTLRQALLGKGAESVKLLPFADKYVWRWPNRKHLDVCFVNSTITHTSSLFWNAEKGRLIHYRVSFIDLLLPLLRKQK